MSLPSTQAKLKFSPGSGGLTYFRLADDRYQTITVREMVTHTSGMPDVQDYEWEKPQYDDGAPADATAETHSLRDVTGY